MGKGKGIKHRLHRVKLKLAAVARMRAVPFGHLCSSSQTKLYRRGYFGSAAYQFSSTLIGAEDSVSPGWL